VAERNKNISMTQIFYPAPGYPLLFQKMSFSVHPDNQKCRRFSE
jgi:hypothetical protein